MHRWMNGWTYRWIVLFLFQFLAAWLIAVGRAATATATVAATGRYDHTTCRSRTAREDLDIPVAPVLASNCKSQKHVLQMDFMFGALCFLERISLASACHGHVGSSGCEINSDEMKRNATRVVNICGIQMLNESLSLTCRFPNELLSEQQKGQP